MAGDAPEKTGTAPGENEGRLPFFSERKWGRGRVPVFPREIGRSPSFLLCSAMARDTAAALMNCGRAPITVAIFIFGGSGKMGAVPHFPLALSRFVPLRSPSFFLMAREIVAALMNCGRAYDGGDFHVGGQIIRGTAPLLFAGGRQLGFFTDSISCR